MLARSTSLVAALALAAVAARAQTPRSGDTARAPEVRAVLFFSPACPHCRDLVEHGLPPIISRFGPRLVIVGVNVLSDDGAAQYRSMVSHFALPPDRQGVPTLVVGERVLVGSEEIPHELPGLTERGLAAGGVDWPDLPLLRQELVARGLAAAPPPPRDTARDSAPQVAAAPAPAPGADAPGAPAPRVPVSTAPPSEQTPAPPVEAPTVVTAPAAPSPAAAAAPGPIVLGTGEAPAGSPSFLDRFLADPVGNSASVVVLVAMLACVVLALAALRRGRARLPRAPQWVVPALALLGVGVAAYLSYVELTGTRAVCGPVGDCNTVQQSAYARLMGVPIGVLGIGGYLAIMAAWAIGVAGREREGAWVVIWAMALGATLFSAYLTFLEPFVIGATCAWCLSSAVIVTLILVVATPRAVALLRAGGRDIA
jgi:uncharacterized membrane protein